MSSVEPCSAASPEPHPQCSSTLPSSDGSAHRCLTKRAEADALPRTDACFYVPRVMTELFLCVSLYRRACRCESALLCELLRGSTAQLQSPERIQPRQKQSPCTSVCNLKVTESGVSRSVCLSLSPSPRGGLHYPGQSSVEQSGGPRPFECRNAPAICCTLELDLQPNSISSPN